MTCYMQHMGWLFEALDLPNDSVQRARLDRALHVSLELPDEAGCPEVWAAIKDLSDERRTELVGVVQHQLAE